MTDVVITPTVNALAGPLPLSVTREDILEACALLNIKESTLNGTSVAAKGQFLHAVAYAKGIAALARQADSAAMYNALQIELLKRSIDSSPTT